MEPECHPPVCDLQPRGLLLLPCFSTHHLWPLGIYLVDSAEVERSLEGCCLCSTVIIESGKHQSQVREQLSKSWPTSQYLKMLIIKVMETQGKATDNTVILKSRMQNGLYAMITIVSKYSRVGTAIECRNSCVGEFLKILWLLRWFFFPCSKLCFTVVANLLFQVKHQCA